MSDSSDEFIYDLYSNIWWRKGEHECNIMCRPPDQHASLAYCHGEWPGKHNTESGIKYALLRCGLKLISKEPAYEAPFDDLPPPGELYTHAYILIYEYMHFGLSPWEFLKK